MVETVEFDCVAWHTPEDGISVSTAFTDSDNEDICRYTILDQLRQEHCIDGEGRCPHPEFANATGDQWRRLWAAWEQGSNGWTPHKTVEAANVVIAEMLESGMTVSGVWGGWDLHLWNAHRIYIEQETFVCRRDDFNAWLRQNTHLIDMVELVAAAAKES